MQIRVVPNCGLGISELGLGTMTWGRDTDEYEAAEQFELFIERWQIRGNSWQTCHGKRAYRSARLSYRHKSGSDSK